MTEPKTTDAKTDEKVEAAGKTEEAAKETKPAAKKTTTRKSTTAGKTTTRKTTAKKPATTPKTTAAKSSAKTTAAKATSEKTTAAKTTKAKAAEDTTPVNETSEAAQKLIDEAVYEFQNTVLSAKKTLSEHHQDFVDAIGDKSDELQDVVEKFIADVKAANDLINEHVNKLADVAEAKVKSSKKNKKDKKNGKANKGKKGAKKSK